MPSDNARQNKVPLLRQVYGVRAPDGSINGQLYTRSIVADAMKAIIIFLLTAMFVGGCDAYKWYVKNKDVPQAFASHCEKQSQSDKDLAGQMGQVLEGIKSLQRSDRHR
jgi:hypothetical protein